MKKKGFTLVELLAVIVILSILILVGAPTLINNLNEKKQEASNKVEELIISAARSYVIDYNLEEPLSLPIESFCEYIDCPIIDPYTNEEISGYVIADEERNYSIVKGKVGFNVVLNGGSNGQTFETEYPAYTTLTIVEPIKVGYEFSHWEVTKGNGIVDGNKVTIGSTDTEIYAMWKANPGLVIDYDGGTVSNPDLATSYKTGTSIDLVPSTKEGYTFSHWEIVEGNSTRSGNVITIGTENTVVKAIWTSNIYTINYYIGNGTDTEGVTKLGTSTCKYNETCTLKGFSDLGGIFPYSKEDNETNGKKNFNWNFYGWGETQTTTTRKYANSASFIYDKTSNINLYAVGSKRFYFYGGVAPTTYLSSLYQYWNPYSTSINYLTSIKIPTATTIDGWTFVGYRTGSNSASWGESTTEAQYATSGVATFPSVVVGTTLKPAYTSYQTARGVYKRTVKLQFASNGGTGTIAAQEKTQYYNTGYSSSGANVSANVSAPTFTLPTSGFTKTGYTISKWAAGSTSGTQYETGASYTGFKPEVTNKTTTQTMYAIWKVGSPVGSYTCANTSAGSGTKVLTYTGNCTMIDDGNGNWRVKFLTSGTLTLGSDILTDAFLVGGGGGGGTTKSSTSYYYYSAAGCGGGGGYTLTKKEVTLNADTNYSINIGDGGDGGSSPTNGKTTTAFGFNASGGSGAVSGIGGNGGSGGGETAEDGASNGEDRSGKGQISTPGPNGETGNTREFGETTGDLYSGGGAGGGAYHSTSGAKVKAGTGGSGGGGSGSCYFTYAGEILYNCRNSDTNGVDNTGGGGGGSNGSKYPAGKGGSGIVIIRNAR